MEPISIAAYVPGGSGMRTTLASFSGVLLAAAIISDACSDRSRLANQDDRTVRTLRSR
jgi:hypothetical protein